MNETNIRQLGDLYVSARGELLANIPDSTVLFRQNIGGVDCESQIPICDHPKIREKIREQEAELKVRQKLSVLTGLGLEYEAILPMHICEDLCAQFSLFNFYRVDKGRVLACLADPPGSTKYGYSILVGILFWPAVLMLVLGIPGLAIGFFIAVLGATFPSIGNYYLEQKDWPNARLWFGFTHLCNPIAYVFAYSQMKKEGTQDMLKKRFWGVEKTDKHFLALSKDERMQAKIDYVEIKLPEPPRDVSERIITWSTAQFPVSVMVEEAGFTIVKDSRLLDVMNSYNDPIAYTIIMQDGFEFAVLIHQYGQLEKEKEMVAYIQDHFESLKNLSNSAN